jgi:hypothetical protein
LSSFLWNYFDKINNKLITVKKEITTSNGTYSLFIKEYAFSNGTDLFFGETKDGCLIITVKNLDSDTIILDIVKYNSKCNLKEDLKEGSETRHLINTAFSFKKTLPNVKYCKLLDTSSYIIHSLLYNYNLIE